MVTVIVSYDFEEPKFWIIPGHKSTSGIAYMFINICYLNWGSGAGRVAMLKYNDWIIGVLFSMQLLTGVQRLLDGRNTGWPHNLEWIMRIDFPVSEFRSLDLCIWALLHVRLASGIVRVDNYNPNLFINLKKHTHTYKGKKKKGVHLEICTKMSLELSHFVSLSSFISFYNDDDEKKFT